MKTKNTWGGRREGAGAKRSSAPRCACGKMTLRRALQIRHKCREVANA